MVDFKLIKKNLKTIVGFADSEFLELLIAMLHTFLLPAAVWAEIGFKWHIIFVAIAGGLFQFYSVGMRDLRCRYYSTVIATIVAFLTVEQYMMTGLLWEAPSRFGWLIIALAAVINQIRVTKQWKAKN
ncbi:hypothetical protein OAR88_00135 [bacterium]|jgi:hypothetical protein|nr:hypothetical protein [bacterium]